MCSNLNLKCAAANEAYKPQTVDQRGGPTCGWCPVRISFLLFIAHFDGGHIKNVDVSGVGLMGFSFMDLCRLLRHY